MNFIMDYDKTTELCIKISTELATLNANMKSTLEKIANHEGRITRLESGTASFKDKIVEYLCKALIVSGLTVASLVGAGGLISKFFAM